MHVCSTIKNHIDSALSAVERNMSTITATYPVTQFDDATNTLQSSLAYHVQTGGNKTRALISLYASDALHLRQSDAIAAATIVETLHNASLIHDDIQDHETERRGQPTVWQKYDVGTAICTGDFLIAKAYAECAKVSDPKLVPELITLVHEAVQETIAGQTVDINCTTVTTTVKNYEMTAIAKSGPLLGLSLSIPLLLAGYKKADIRALLKPCIEPFALSYQIIDDLHDVAIDAEHDCLNLVNVLAQEMSLKEAREYAYSRTELLLGSAKRQLSLIPNHAGVYLEYCIEQLRHKSLQVSS